MWKDRKSRSVSIGESPVLLVSGGDVLDDVEQPGRRRQYVVLVEAYD